MKLATIVMTVGLLFGGLILIEFLYRHGALEGLRYTSAALLVAAVFFLVKR